MEALETEAFTIFTNNFLKTDRNFRISLANWLLDDQLSGDTDNVLFSYIVELVFDHVSRVDESLYDEDQVEALLEKLLSDQQVSEFVRVTRTMNHVLKSTEISPDDLSKYLDKLQFAKDGRLDLLKTTKDICDTFDAKKIGVFPKLNDKQMNLLQSLDLEQLDILSNFSLPGTELLIKFARMTKSEQLFIFYSHPEILKLSKSFGSKGFHSLLTIQPVERDTLLSFDAADVDQLKKGTSLRAKLLRSKKSFSPEFRDLLGIIISLDTEEFRDLKVFFKRHSVQLAYFGPDGIDVLSKMIDLNPQELKTLFTLDELQLMIITDLNEEQRDMLIQMEHGGHELHEMIKATKNFNKVEWEAIVSLRRNEFEQIMTKEHDNNLSKIVPLFPEGANSLPLTADPLTEIEEETLMGLSAEQRKVLAKVYPLRPDGLEMINNLNSEQMDEVLRMVGNTDREKQPETIMQKVLSKRMTNLEHKKRNEIATLTPDEWKTFRSAINSGNKAQSVLFNLSETGIRVLKAMTELNEEQLKLALRLSESKLAVLATLPYEDGELSNLFVELGNLDEKEARVLLNLNPQQKAVLLKSKIDGNRNFMADNEDMGVFTKYIDDEHWFGWRFMRSSVSSTTNWSSDQWKTYESLSKDERNLYATLNGERVDLLSDLLDSRIERVLPFQLWTLLLEPTKMESLNLELPTLLRRVDKSDQNRVKMVELIATVLTNSKLQENEEFNIENNVGEIIGREFGSPFSTTFYLNLLIRCMNDGLDEELFDHFKQKIRDNAKDLTFVGKNYDFWNTERLFFFRWILVQYHSDDNFHQITRSALFVLARDRNLIVLKNLLSANDGIRDKEVAEALRHQFKDERYFLTKSLFFSRVGLSNSRIDDGSISKWLAKIFHKKECFSFLNSKITEDMLQRYALATDALGKTVLEYSLLSNRGVPIDLLKNLDKERLEKIFDSHSESIVHSGARRGRLDLLEFFKDRVGSERLLGSIAFNNYEVLNSFMDDVKLFHDGSHSIQYYLNLSGVLKLFAEVDPQLDTQLYQKICSQYISHVESRVYAGDMRTIVDNLVNDRLTREELEKIMANEPKADFDPRQAHCGSKSKRSLQMPCVDSNDADDIKEEGIEELFDQPDKTLRFYDTLRKISDKVSRGEPIEQSLRERFLKELRNINPRTVDPIISDVVDELRKKGQTDVEIRSIFISPKTAERIEELASGAGLIFSVFQVGQHLMNRDTTGLTYDALGFYIMPEIGSSISKQILQLGDEWGSVATRLSAPILGRIFTNFFAYLGLKEAIEARIKAEDLVDQKYADLNIITNSVFVSVDVSAMITGTMSSIGMETGLLGELLGPIGVPVTIVSLIASYLIEVSLKVDKLAEQMDMTKTEEHDAYWSLLWTGNIPDEIENKLNVKKIYETYLSRVLKVFQSHYNRIAVSLPSLFITVEEYLEKKNFFADGIAADINAILETMGRERKNNKVEMDFTGSARIVCGSSEEGSSTLSQLIPHTIGEHKLICGPKEGSIRKKDLNKTVNPWSVRFIEAPFEVPISETLERWYTLQDDTNVCQNVVLYDDHSNQTSETILFYMTLDSSILLSNNTSIDLIFHGTNLSVTDESVVNDSSPIALSHYYLTKDLHACRIRKRGLNFFYTTEGILNCDLGEMNNQQNNIAVIKGNFKDSRNVHSVVGSVNDDRIEASHAMYVDGKGGNDTIVTQNSTFVKGYSGDSIEGNGVLLFPGKVGQIETIIVHNQTMIHHENGGRLRANKSVLVRTSDGFLLFPTKVDDHTQIVTNLLILKYVQGNVSLEEELSALRSVSNANFNLIKQLMSNNYDIILSDHDHHSFHQDKGFHNFYWEGSDEVPHLYVLDNTNSNVSISQANGIIDLRLLGIHFNETSSVEESDGSIAITNGDLFISLLPNYRDIKITFDGSDYYGFVNGIPHLEYCSHVLEVNRNIRVNGSFLQHHFNCFKFESDKVLFTKSNDDLVLVADIGRLSITDYYSLIQRTVNLSIKLNYALITPDKFRKRASNPRKLRFYTVDERGLQIYHNQPNNSNQIGVVDLRKMSVLDCDLSISGNVLVFPCQNNVSLRVERWTDYAPGREIMFAFKDCNVWNADCIITNCHPEKIFKEFHKQQALKRNLLALRRKREIDEYGGELPVTNDANGLSSWINNWGYVASRLTQGFVRFVNSFTRYLPPPVQSDSSSFEPLDWSITRSWMSTNMTLGALLFETFVKRRYPILHTHSISYGETLVHAANITEEFERILRSSSEEFHIPMIDVDYHQVYAIIAGHMWRGNYSHVNSTLQSIVESMNVMNEGFVQLLSHRIEDMLGP